MQRIVHVLAILIFLSAPGYAGVTYEFTSSTTGLSNETISGNVQAEGDRIRVDISKGDGTVFRNGSYIVSSNAGRTLTIVDPGAKNYYEIDFSQMLGGTESMLGQLGADVKFELRDPQISISAPSDAGKIEGFPVKKSKMNVAYQFVITGLPRPITMKMKVGGDVWWTDQIPASVTSFLQLRGLRTGVDAIDTMIAAQQNAIKGFPLKQITTTIISMGGNEMTSTTTSTVRNVKQANVAPEIFAMPAGFTKTPNPLEKMFGR